MISKGNI